MDEFLVQLGIVLLGATLTTVIADYGFDQHWNFFLVLLIWAVIMWGGILILDGDGDFF